MKTATAPIAKTEAIPLRVSAFSNTSHIITWLTQDYGKLATIMKGACRPKRLGAGQYDIGYRCELLFYERPHRNLYTLRDCTALDTRRSLRGDWQRTAAISYISLLALKCSMPSEHMPDLYELINNAFDFIEATPAPHTTIVLATELALLNLHGTAPQLKNCTICRQPPPHQNQYLSPQAGGLVCENCMHARSYHGKMIAPEHLATLSRLQYFQWDDPIDTATVLPSDVQDHLGPFCAYYLDIPPHSRNIAFQMNTMPLKKSA